MHMNPRSIVTSLLLVASWAASGCGANLVVGSGRIVEESRTIGAFSKVEVSDGLRLIVETGPAAPLVIEGDDNLLPLIVTEVRGDTLVVEVPPGTSLQTSHGIRARATSEGLIAANMSGGSLLRAAELRGDDLTVDASGGSVVELTDVVAGRSLKISSSGGSTLSVAGVAPEMELNGSGGTVFRAEALAVGGLKVNLSGGSVAKVKVDGRVDGALSGGSILTVLGDTTIGAVEQTGGSKVEEL